MALNQAVLPYNSIPGVTSARASVHGGIDAEAGEVSLLVSADFGAPTAECAADTLCSTRPLL